MYLRLTEMYSKVLHSQRIQYDTARIQRHLHHKEHTEVKKKGVLRYAFIIIWCLIWHYNWLLIADDWWLITDEWLLITDNHLVF